MEAQRKRQRSSWAIVVALSMKMIGLFLSREISILAIALLCCGERLQELVCSASCIASVMAAKSCEQIQALEASIALSSSTHVKFLTYLRLLMHFTLCIPVCFLAITQQSIHNYPSSCISMQISYRVSPDSVWPEHIPPDHGLETYLPWLAPMNKGLIFLIIFA